MIGSSVPSSDTVEVWEQRPGLWRWVFRAGGDHTEILSNETYRSLEEALRSARVAYPRVPVLAEEPPRASMAPAIVAGFMVVLAVGATIWWLRSRRGREFT